MEQTVKSLRWITNMAADATRHVTQLIEDMRLQLLAQVARNIFQSASDRIALEPEERGRIFRCLDNECIRFPQQQQRTVWLD